MFLKRLFDIVASFCGIVILFPLIVIVSILIKLTSKGPVLFKQVRVTKNGRLFKIYKFRTMRENSEGNKQITVGNDSRITGVGHILRKTKLDELPQLFNVLKGDMSLIGPRPLLPRYLELYNSEQARRHDVRPGITGWAQVNGRNAISWTRKFELDVWYVDHCSFMLDLKIVCLSIHRGLFRKDILISDNTQIIDVGYRIKKENSFDQ